MLWFISRRNQSSSASSSPEIGNGWSFLYGKDEKNDGLISIASKVIQQRLASLNGPTKDLLLVWSSTSRINIWRWRIFQSACDGERWRRSWWRVQIRRRLDWRIRDEVRQPWAVAERHLRCAPHDTRVSYIRVSSINLMKNTCLVRVFESAFIWAVKF